MNAKRITTTIISAFILMLFALYDNFPILTSDTGTYIVSGFTMTPPVDRPIFYGLFLRLTSLGASVWLTVFFQCLLLAYVLIKFMRKLVPAVTNLQLLGLVLFTSVFTICGWFAGQLMPDIFTSILVLSVTTYLVFVNTQREKVLLLAVIFFSVLMHNSNFMVLTLFAVLYLLFTIVRKTGKGLKHTLPLFFISLLSWLAFCTSNALGGNEFTASRSTHVFVMGKLVESGVLKTYLDRACPERNYKICAHINELPLAAWQFHWDAASPLQKEGGWDANKEEYNTIIADIFSRPKYYPYIAYKSIEATARQLALFHIDSWYTLPCMKFDEESSPYKAIEKYFPHELNQLKVSRQNTKILDIGFYDNMFAIVVIVSCIAVLFTIPAPLKKQFFILAACIGVMILLNAFVTAVLSSVNSRFNARVSWLIPFVNVLMLLKISRYYREVSEKR